MNAYLFNGRAGQVFRQSIVNHLKINHSQIYRVVKSININGIIETKDGRKYKLKLEEIHEEDRELPAGLK